MAYATKYQMEWATPTADCRLSVQQDGHSGSVTDLVPAPGAFEITWSQQEREDLTLPLKVSTARIRFIGDSEGELVQEVFDGGDTEYRALFERDPGGGYSEEWRGFLATDLWRDNPHVDSDVVELEAIDGIALLENKDFDPSSKLALYQHARNILRGLHQLSVSANMEWYPYRSGNQLPANELPLGHLFAATNAFDELEPIEGEDGFETTAMRNERRVLEAILERFGMECFQSRGEWTMRQRSQIQSNRTIKTWPNATAAQNANPTTRDLSRSLPARYRRDRPRGRVERLRTVESVHTYDGLGELVKNGSFEPGFGGWTVSEPDETVVERKDYNNTPLTTTSTQEDTWVVRLDAPGTQTTSTPSIEQRVPAILHDAGPKAAYQVQWDVALGGQSTIPETQLEVVRSGRDDAYVQTGTLSVQAPANPADDGSLFVSAIQGASSVIIIPKGATLPILRDGNSGHERVGTITLEEPAYGGQEELVGRISTNVSTGDNQRVVYWYWVLGKTETDGFGNPIGAHIDEPGEMPKYPESEQRLTQQSITVPQHTPTGSPIVGDLRIEHSVNFTTSVINQTWVDHVSAQIVINEEPVAQTSYTALDDQSGRGIEIPQILGDGPTYDHPRALQLTGVEVTKDWQVGAYGSGASRSGQLLEEVTAENAMRQQRSTLDRRTHEMGLRGSDEVWPEDVFDIGGTLYTVSYLRRVFTTGDERAEVELTELKGAGTSGLTRTYQMETAAGGVGGITTSSGGGTGSGAAQVVENQAASTFPGSPPADQLLTQLPFHSGWTFNEVIIYAHTAPTSDYDITVDYNGTQATYTLPAGDHLLIQSISQSILREGVLRVLAPSSQDPTLEELSVSFDMDPIAGTGPTPPPSTITRKYTLSPQPGTYTLT